MRPAKKIFGTIQRDNMAMLLILGLCPALAITTSMKNAFAMGVATIFVVTLSNFTISIFRKKISYNTKLFAFFAVTAAYTSVADLILQAFFPEFSKALGIYVPLIAVNGLILQRAEHFALKNSGISSLLDGLYVGLLFTIALMIAGAIRELLGNGSILDHYLIDDTGKTLLFIILPPGAFITLGFLIAAMQKSYSKIKK